MPDVVTFDTVSKKFRRGEWHDSLRDLIPALATRLIRQRPAADTLRNEEFWAIRNVSFGVGRGESLGIIGPNGAGKSTVLKLLTRILKPTLGSCHVTGRVGALIEVAAGFHPDLTGRENIFLQGAIMGMRKAQIAERLDEIIEFSGISRFIDTQVKRYSSGMQARLGFSVAAHMDPDVLFVDEVLSVGDMSFQSRCLERMRRQIDNGVTLIFVSHNLQAVASLCHRALVLGGGQLAYDGPVDGAITAYLSASQVASRRSGTRPQFVLESAQLRTQRSQAAHTIAPHTACVLTAVIRCEADSPPVTFGFEFERTLDLFYCYGVSTEDIGLPRRAFKAGDRVSVELKFVAHFARGHYRINLNVRDPLGMSFFLVAENAATFTVVESASYQGVVDVSPSCSITPADAAVAVAIS